MAGSLEERQEGLRTSQLALQPALLVEANPSTHHDAFTTHTQGFQKSRPCSSGFLEMEKPRTPQHSSTLAWKIPWVEEPGSLQSMRSLRVGHD